MSETAPDRIIVMYGRTSFCPYQRIAERLFNKLDLTVTTIMIDKDEEAKQRVLDWTGFQAVPTIIAARPNETLPFEDPAPLTVSSPRGVNRGSMITEPNESQLTTWLEQNRFIQSTT